MSYRLPIPIPKLLTRKKTKTKEQRQSEHQDALERTHLASKTPPIEQDYFDRFSKGGLEAYYAAKQDAKESGAAGMVAYHGGQREQERFLSKYESANNFASLRNVDEDDVSLPDADEARDEDGMRFDDMRRDFGAFMGLDEDGDADASDMPIRSQRSQAFNEELDGRGHRGKGHGEQGADELPAVIIEEGDSDGDLFGDLAGEPGQLRLQSERMQLGTSDMKAQAKAAAVQRTRESEASDLRATERLPSAVARKGLKEEELKEPVLEDDEALDTVAPLLPARDALGFAGLAKGAVPPRNASVMVASSAQMRGVQQAADVEKRIHMISGGAVQPGKQSKDDQSSRLRGPTVIQLDRMERMKRKIQRD